MADDEKREYFTIVFQYSSDDGDPTTIPPHFVDRVITASSLFHIDGFGLEVTWGKASQSILNQVDTDTEE